jgi:basic membrane lipoprotein Med (substrate-binding protein (PBP1-ABC) superfamily)
MVDMSKKYPKVEFRHPTSLWTPDKHPMNLGGYFCYLDQAHYVNGIAAGLSTQSNKIGYVAAKPIAIVLRNINAFTMGVRKVNPNAKVQLVFTGEWSMPVREAEATNALVAAGNDVIACHVDSPKVVIETAEKAGVKTLGHNASQAQLAPKGFITGAENKWETVYKSFAASLGAGRKLPNQFFGRRRRAGAQGRQRSDRRSEGRQADLRRPHQEQHRQAGHRQELRQLRPGARENGLPGGRRDRDAGLNQAQRRGAMHARGLSRT